MQISSGPANRCVRSRGNRGRPCDSDRKDARRAARTSATMRAVREAGESSARLSGQPLCRRWRAHRSAFCDKQLGVPWEVPFVGIEPAIEMTWAQQKRLIQCNKYAIAD